MPIAQVTVSTIYPPDKYPDLAGLMCQSAQGNMRLGIKAAQQHLFQVGQSYLVQYDNRTSAAGKSYSTFTGFADGNQTAGMTPAGQAVNGPVNDLKAQAAELMKKAEAAEKAERDKATAIGKVHHDEELKAAQIFVTGVVGRAAGNGLAASDLKGYALAAVDAWKAAKAALDGKLQPSTVAAAVGPVQSENPADLNDSIPF